VIPTLLFFFGMVAVLVFLSVWSLRGPARGALPELGPASFAGTCRPHVAHLPQIRRALAPPDFAYLSSRGWGDLARRLRKERRRIALAYLPAVKQDFARMLRLVRVIAGLSPEIRTLQEWERLRLTTRFYWHYQRLRLGLLLGFTLAGQLQDLSLIVSGLSVRLESSMRELGERAVTVAKLASSLDSSGVDTA
jgi:hypothetical protein